MATIPSIAMIPSGYKAGKVYSVLPTNGDADLTFTRVGALPSYNATRVNQNGLIEEVLSNVPRLDYSDGGCPSLLVEPQSTNLLTYSEDFSNASWNKTAGGTGVAPIVTANQGISPDGTLTADRIQFNLGGGTTASDVSLVTKSVTVASLATTSKSIYLKSNTSSSYEMIIYEFTNASGTNNKKITVTTEWQRFDIFGSVPATTSGIAFGLRNINQTGLSDVADVLVWGTQLEASPYATSYIPTVASTVTRVAETVSKTGLSSYINSVEGVLYFEGRVFANNVGSRRITLTKNGSNEQIRIEYSNTTNQINAVLYDGTTNQSVIAVTSPNALIDNKIAFRYKANDFALFVNGVKLGSDPSGTTLPSNTLDTLTLSFVNAQFFGKIKGIEVYPTSLSDAELISLTSN